MRVDVPAGALAWDVRLREVSGAVPEMVVRRDLLPNSAGTSASWPGGGSSSPHQAGSWPSGNQWLAGATSSADWAAWYYDIGAPTYQPARPRLLMAMGRPLEAGTYYIGIYNSSATQASSYTIDSRGIGAAGSGLTYEVSAPVLPFQGGSATITNLAPREARYFKITIPANQPSWEMTLEPSTGEMLLVLRRDAIPDFSAGEAGEANWEGGAPYNDRQIRMKKAGPERYVMLPGYTLDSIPAGDYYLAVVSEGVNPGTPSSTIGTGTSSGTLASLGPLAVTDLGVATPAGLTQSVSLAAGQIKAFQFTVPLGTNSLEVRRETTSGAPTMEIYPGTRLPGPGGYGSDGGGSGTVVNPIFTQASPPTGTWSVIVQSARDNPSSANLVFRQKQNIPLNFAAALNAGGGTHTDARQMISGEYNVYQVSVPATEDGTIDGKPVIGWIIQTDVLQGAVSLQVYKSFANPTGGASVAGGTAVIVPPFLTLGDTWYVRVAANGLTNYTITSRPVTLERPVWQMPGFHNLTFGDSGTDSGDVPLAGDRGVDLAQGEWHFYVVDVPEGNPGLLRTELQAISGNPDLYIREDGVPTTSHTSNPPNSGSTLYHRQLTGSVTEYGNWVPLNGRTERQLQPGRWYLGVKASGNSNVRYRLIASTGTVTDLALDPSVTTPQVPSGVVNQLLPDNDWRYYRFTVPADAPNNWALTFGQQVGDVVMWLRDSLPPGQSSLNTASSSYIKSWSSDSKNQGPYPNYDPAGTYNFTTPPLRPGHTYYVGFRSNNSATLSVSSAVSGGTIGTPPTLAFYDADPLTPTLSVSVPANGSLLYQIPVPVEATRLKYTGTHPATITTRLEQGTLPGTSGGQHYSTSTANLTANWPLSPTTWPWVPGQTYYLRLINTAATAQTVTVNIDGKNAQTEDEDNDGLPDAWEKLYFGNLTSNNATSDPDNDGNSNAVELADGTNPKDANSAKYTLTLAARNGTAAANPVQVKYDKGAVAMLTNTPDADYDFLGWAGGPFRADDFAMRATGTITLPTGGTWTFGTNSDDGLRLKVNNVAVINTSGGASDALGQITLAAGSYAIELVYFERGGGEHVEVFAAPGSFTSMNGSFRLVGDTANGGLAVETLVGGLATPGFTVRQVESLTTQIGSISAADALLAGTYAKRQDVTAISPVVNFSVYGRPSGRFPEDLDFPLNLNQHDEPLALAMTGNYTLTAVNTIPLGTALDTPNLVWAGTGNAPWLGESDAAAQDATDDAASGPVENGQSSFLNTTVAGPGTLTFWWKVSSQTGDTLSFRIDAATQTSIQGEVGWTQRTQAIAAGVHSLTWVYAKDASGSAGSDRGWLDQVTFTSTAYSTWATSFGLTGNGALPDTVLAGDGLTNLQKFAYNLPPTQAGAPTLVPGTGTAGLPIIRFVGTGNDRRLVVEFIRRKTGGVLYIVQFADSLAANEWEPATLPPVVTSIDATWERVVVEDQATLGGNPGRFGRVLTAKP